MSSTPPPGWYRDPSYPLVERWWDGTAWTDHRRQPETETPQEPPTGPRPAAGGPGRAKVIALTAAGAVLVAAVVTGVVVLARDAGGSGSGAEAKTTAGSSATTTPSASSPSASVSEPSADDPSVVEDELNGITLPLPEGWVRAENVADDDVVMTTPGTYDCPGDPGLCRHGQVLSRTATTSDASPEALARGDIADAMDTAFDRDGLGSRPFGGVTSHREVKAGTVAVGGREGYFVRWRVTAAKGPGGYVQSLAFPSSVGSEAPVIVRFAFDAGADGPPLTDMDRITKGIRPIGDPATGGGVGSSIGASR
ncbi:DUF2510 domain-containing protein [Streptomyces avermitilis]|uniref:DUF2510 domain-containing protein n=1 Tax=Streptomyces avermitilis TaxID=33903 RepID=UPI003820CDDE